MENIEKYIELANFAFESKQYDEAVNYYLEAIKIEPTNYYLHYKKSQAVALKITPFEVNPRAFMVAAEKYINTSENRSEIIKQVFIDIHDFYKLAYECLENYMKPLRNSAAGASFQNALVRPVGNYDNTTKMSYLQYLPIHKKCLFELLESAHGFITKVDCSKEIEDNKFRIVYMNTITRILMCYISNIIDDFPSVKKIASEILDYYWKYATDDEKRGIININFHLGYLEVKVEGNNEIQTAGGRRSGGCYVATAVYGSYDCPQVWTLRRYRDYSLAKTWYGRMFIRSYYAVSPTIVKYFGKTEWFKNFWRNKLDKMIQNLQENGVESTPYEDQKW